MKITIVAGARPNFMKIAPLCRAIDAAREAGQDISYRVVYTGPENDPALEAYVGKEAVLGIRPEDIDVAKADSKAVFEAKVDIAEMMGSEIYLYLTYEGQKIVARVPSKENIKADDVAKLALRTDCMHVFDKETEKIICH